MVAVDIKTKTKKRLWLGKIATKQDQGPPNMSSKGGEMQRGGTKECSTTRGEGESFTTPSTTNRRSGRTSWSTEYPVLGLGKADIWTRRVVCLARWGKPDMNGRSKWHFNKYCSFPDTERIRIKQGLVCPAEQCLSSELALMYSVSLCVLF